MYIMSNIIYCYEAVACMRGSSALVDEKNDSGN